MFGFFKLKIYSSVPVTENNTDKFVYLLHYCSHVQLFFVDFERI